MAAQPGARRQVDAIYSYTDEDEQELFQVVRFEPKDFRQRHRDPNNPKAKRGGWAWDMEGVRRVPYKLPELLFASLVESVVYVCEGERDVESLMAAGEVATCNPGGAGKWRSEYARYFTGQTVVIVADKDEPGRAHARQIAASLRGVAASVRVVEPAEGKDASDHFDAGYGVDEFVAVEVESTEPKARWDLLLERAVQRATDEGRNNACLWLVCQLRDNRFEEAEAWRVVERFVSQVAGRGKDAFPVSEAREVFDKNFFTDARAPWIPDGGTPHTDLGNAERLIARHGQNLRFVAAWKSWVWWDERRWRRDTMGEVDRMAAATIRALYRQAADDVDPERRNTLIKWARASERHTSLKAMVDRARSLPGVGVEPGELDRNPMELNLNNGTLNLATGILYPHLRESLMSKLAPVEYDPKAKCPTWDDFLRRIQPDEATRAFLQRAAGYSLTGDVSEQVLFIAYGSGANGKSTFFEALRAMLGDYAQKAPAELFVVKRSGAVPADVARLPGKRFVSASETEDGARLAESVVKDLTGGDTVTARYLHENFFEFIPTHKLWLSTNHVPSVHGAEDAIWRRLRLIPFTVTIPPDEQDKRIADRLRRELPGILRWAVEGCAAWQEHGLGESRSVIEATEKYRRDSDSFGQFLASECTVGHDQEASAGALYVAYELWASLENLKVMSKIAFSRKLRERGFEDAEVGKAHTKIWRGIGLPEATGIRLVSGGRAR